MGRNCIEQALCSEKTTLTLEVTKTAREWANELGLDWETVRKRRYRGWSWNDALGAGHRRTTLNRQELR